MSSLFSSVADFISVTGFSALNAGDVLMLGISCLLLYLAIQKGFEPLLLVPIGFGMLLSNLPETGIFDEGGLNPLLLLRGEGRRVSAPDLHGHRRADGLRPPAGEPQDIIAGRSGASSASSPRCSGAYSWASISLKPAPSASSAARTAPRPSTPPRNWRPICWVPSPWPPTAIWRSCR